MSPQMQPVPVGPVDVLCWNPRRPLPLRPRRFFRWTSRLPFAPRVENFGDVLGPWLIAQIIGESRIKDSKPYATSRAQMSSAGSVIHMLPPTTTVWGSGVNGKSLGRDLPRDLHVRSVRGPRTREYLRESGLNAPEVFGDPALLLPRYWTTSAPPPANDVLVLPNLNDLRDDLVIPRGTRIVDPRLPLHRVVQEIRASRLVVGSSLHGIILAEAFGIPARCVMSETEPDFKYLDYFEGTGRFDVTIASSLSEAVDLGGASPVDWDPDPILRAFPWHLFPTTEE